MRAYTTACALACLAVAELGAEESCRPGEAVREEGFVEIGGIEQWVTLRGDDCANPALLMVHGGPGNPLSPFAESLYGAWEKDFTLVQWDQRGAGRTYGRHEPSTELTVERYNATELTLEMLVRDGVEVAEYVRRRLGKERIVLTGASWGSALGVSVVRARPELFHAYVGVSQLVDYKRNLAASYARVAEIARAKEDSAGVALVDELGPPPWENPRNFGRLRRLIRVYEAEAAGPPAEMARAPAYDTPEIQAAYYAGEELSFVKYVGLQGDGYANRVDLPALGTKFSFPVYLVHGAEDLVTTPEVARAYYERLAVPDKDFVLLPGVGHDTAAPLVEAQFRLLTERVLPLVRAAE